ncbi:MAG: hypothetical protein ABW360_13460 [Phenylobacterium sp.]
MKQLARFTITVREEDFVLTLVDDTGESVDYATSADQLDLVIDALDELLSEEDDLDEDGEAAAYQKPLG